MATNDLRIENLDVALFRVPPAGTWIDATHHIEHLEFVLVELHAAGQTGIGWTYTLGNGGLAVCSLIKDALRTRVVGARADPDALLEDLWWTLHPLGRGGISSLAVAAIDVALWDLKGHAAGRPVHELLGGHSARVPAYASGIDLHLDPPQLADLVAGYMAQGYGAVKIKVGDPDPARDIARVRAARDVIGPEVRLMLDANQKWTGEQAAERAPLRAVCALLAGRAVPR